MIPGHRIVLDRSNAPETSLGCSIGFQSLPSGGVSGEISAVVSTGLATKEGVKFGQQVLAINDTLLSGLTQGGGTGVFLATHSA